jgi:hypothetical protein
MPMDAAGVAHNTEIHATVDALGSPKGLRLTPGVAYELHCADVLVEDAPTAIVIAD